MVDSLDLDVEEVYRHSLKDEIEGVLAEVGASGVPWQLHLATAPEDVAKTLLDMTGSVNARLLVIGARRRSPGGKFLLGSLTQTLILEAEVPILVVKSPG